MPWVPISESGINYNFFAYSEDSVRIEGSRLYGSTSEDWAPEWRLLAWEAENGDLVPVRITVESYLVSEGADTPAAFVFYDAGHNEVWIENEALDGWSPNPVEAFASYENTVRYSPAGAPSPPAENYVFLVEVWSDDAPEPDPSAGKRIVFSASGTEPAPQLPAVGRGHAPMSGFGYADTITALGAVGLASIPISQGYSRGAEVAPPSFGDGIGSILLGQAYSYGGVAVWPAHGDASVRVTGFGYDASSFGLGTLPLYGFGESVSEDDELPPPIWQDGAVFVGELMSLGAAADYRLTMVGAGHDALAAQVSRYRGSLRAQNTADDELEFSEAVGLVYLVLVEEGILGGASGGADLTQVGRAVDRLLVAGAARTYAEAVNAVVSGLLFAALVDELATEQVVESLLTSAVLFDRYTALERAVTEALFADVATPTATFFLHADDALVGAIETASFAELAVRAADTLGLTVRFGLDSGDYIAWVLNTESTGLTRYTNYPFNSFAKVGDRYYGLTSGGLYRLDGDSDEGEPIQARIRTGMFDFGDRVIKGIPEVYVGYSSDGTMRLRTIFVHPKSGEKTAADYRLMPRGAATTRENRFQGGRGVFSVDWDFELENVDGSGFELESIEFLPVPTSRRVRG